VAPAGGLGQALRGQTQVDLIVGLAFAFEQKSLDIGAKLLRAAAQVLDL